MPVHAAGTVGEKLLLQSDTKCSNPCAWPIRDKYTHTAERCTRHTRTTHTAQTRMPLHHTQNYICAWVWVCLVPCALCFVLCALLCALCAHTRACYVCFMRAHARMRVLYKGGLGHDATRVQRKQWQLESLFKILSRIIKKIHSNRTKPAVDEPALTTPITIVDFGSGSGNSALPLAALLPECKFVLLDGKKACITIGQRRTDSASLTNVEW